MSERRPIYFCTTTKNRTNNLVEMVRSLEALRDDQTRLHIADFKSTDAKLQRVVSQFKLPINVITLAERYFNRSRGLNAAASNVPPGAIIFFIDADMIVPLDFAAILREKVKPGFVYLPVCYSLHQGKPRAHRDSSRHPSKANGWWRNEGCGMVGILQEDFRRVGSWDEAIGQSYGKEDGDFARRATSMLEGIRERCQGLFHLWHPNTKSFKSRHHRRPS